MYIRKNFFSILHFIFYHILKYILYILYYLSNIDPLPQAHCTRGINICSIFLTKVFFSPKSANLKLHTVSGQRSLQQLCEWSKKIQWMVKKNVQQLCAYCTEESVAIIRSQWRKSLFHMLADPCRTEFLFNTNFH